MSEGYRQSLGNLKEGNVGFKVSIFLTNNGKGPAVDNTFVWHPEFEDINY